MNRFEKAKWQKRLGNLGEEAALELLNGGSNLNKIKNNFPLFDLIDNNGKLYSVKTRQKFTPKDNKINGEYNIVNRTQAAKKLKSFYSIAKEMFLSTNKDSMKWIAIPYEEDTWCPVYVGSFENLPANDMNTFFEGKATYVRIKMRENYTRNYNILGYVKFDLENYSFTVKVKHV